MTIHLPTQVVELLQKRRPRGSARFFWSPSIGLALCSIALLIGLEGCAASPLIVRGQNPEPRSSAPGDSEVSSILRNRLVDTAESGEAPEFAYPDVGKDPIDHYREVHGVSRPDADRFVFPWMVNLIFEDRWLLNEPDPRKALDNQIQRRLKVDIRDPDPDTANFPNGAYTLPKGRAYIENSPIGFYGSTPNGSQPRLYQWEYLLRYGLTDNLEFRIFSNGMSYMAGAGKQPSAFGYSPLAFDLKANFWEENTRYFVPAMGMEVYLQTEFGSSAFNNGMQPSINLLFDQSLPFGFGLEYNLGVTGVQTPQRQNLYQFSAQWSLQHEVVEDFDVFFHGFYNASALPRLLQFQGGGSSYQIPDVAVLGGGGIWTVNDRWAVFGSYNFGLTDASPQTIALLGFAYAL